MQIGFEKNLTIIPASCFSLKVWNISVSLTLKSNRGTAEWVHECEGWRVHVIALIVRAKNSTEKLLDWLNEHKKEIILETEILEIRS